MEDQLLAGEIMRPIADGNGYLIREEGSGQVYKAWRSNARGKCVLREDAPPQFSKGRGAGEFRRGDRVRFTLYEQERRGATLVYRFCHEADVKTVTEGDE